MELFGMKLELVCAERSLCMEPDQAKRYEKHTCRLVVLLHQTLSEWHVVQKNDTQLPGKLKLKQTKYVTILVTQLLRNLICVLTSPQIKVTSSVCI